MTSGPHAFVLEDPCISNRHLKFYSVIHDQHGPTDIQPMIYVEDMSSNGIYWNDSYVGSCHPPILLSDGDLLKISPRFFIRFHSLQKLERYVFDTTRASELKVGYWNFFSSFGSLSSVVLRRQVSSLSSETRKRCPSFCSSRSATFREASGCLQNHQHSRCWKRRLCQKSAERSSF